MTYLNYTIQNGIGLLKFNRPDKYNAFNTEFLTELSALLHRENQNSDLKVLILTGEGKAFSSGVDLKALLDLKTVEQARNFALLLESTSEQIYNFSKPTIALLNGLALGGGFGYATAADIRIMSVTAKVGYPAVKLGAILPATCTMYLKALIGDGRTKDLLLTGRMIESPEALQMGLINYEVSPEQMMNFAFEKAKQIMEAPELALLYTKNTVNFTTKREIEAAKLYAADNFAFLSQTQEWQKRMQAFADKKK
jgi:enoyl-CoA hydratase/carnithine racemase